MEQFRLLVEGVQDYAIFLLDPNGVIVSWNPGAARIKGYQASEIVGKHFSTFYTQEDLNDRKPERELVIARETGKYEEEGWRLRKDGSRFWANVLITALFDENKNLRGFAKVTRDITGRRENDRVRSIVDNVIDGIITIDDQGIIESFNPAAEKIFGYSSEEVLGQNVRLLMPQPYSREHDSYLENYKRTGIPKIIGIGREVIGRRKDGSIFPMDLAVGKFTFQGRMAFTGVVRDITERKEAERQLHYFAAELQDRNAELARSNRELDDFAYIASHDLKEPLRGIHNYACFLLEDYASQLDDEGKNKLQTLQVLTQRMESLIDSLLEFSRVGRLELAMKEIDLNQVLHQVQQNLLIQLKEKRVMVRIPRPLPVVKCDRIRVGEIFANLVSNALKYNDKPHPWIEVGFLDPSPETGEVPVFYVKDNGIGIREKHFENIFRIFKRLHGRDQFGGGTGVGLTIVKKIIERHGGTIWLESKPGEGTTFYFTLEPRKNSSLPDERPARPAGHRHPS